MTTNDEPLRRLMNAIAADDEPTVLGALQAAPELARQAAVSGATRAAAEANFLVEIGCYVYAGDTALHIAAAGYHPDLIRRLIDLGADVHAANRRGATPLHYAASGSPGSAWWNPEAQAQTIAALIAAGADPNAPDRNTVAPLHRAVRTRCAAAVAALIAGGADIGLKNGNGSTPLDLATRQTGRGGSGSPEAKAEQAEIVQLLTQPSPLAGEGGPRRGADEGSIAFPG